MKILPLIAALLFAPVAFAQIAINPSGGGGLQLGTPGPTGPAGINGINGAPGPNCSVSSPPGTCDMQGADIVNLGSPVAALLNYIDITSSRYGGICDGAPHVVNGVDVNVAAFNAAANTWKAGGYPLGNPPGASCVFTLPVQFAATAGTQSPLIIDLHGGTWRSQVTATSVARIYVDTGGNYSVCPTGVTVGGQSIPATITCTGTAMTSVVMTNPNTGPTFSGAPAVAFTGGTGTAATAHAALSGAFNFTIANPGSGSITLNGGLKIDNANFQDDGFGAAVLVNVDGGPYPKAFFGKVSLNHSIFKTTIEATTAFQSESTFESGVYMCSFQYGSGDPTAASIGYYGFALLPAGVGQGTGEWTVMRSRSAGFEHGFYTASGIAALNFYALQPLLSYEEGLYVQGSAVINGVHTEATWANNPNESTYRAGTYCSGACLLSGVNDLQSGKGNSNYAVSLFAAANVNSSIVGGWSFDEGQAASGTVVSATIAAGGSGGTNGTQTVTGTTGTGTKFQASVTVSGGIITAIKSISNRGTYSVNPTTPTNEPVTGGGLTGAALNLVMGTRAYTYAAVQGAVSSHITLLGIPVINGLSDYTPVNGNATIIDSNLIPSGGVYAVNQSTTLQWIQVASGNTGYYAIGVSEVSNGLPETYNALATGVTGTYLVFGRYTDGSGNLHEQVCTSFVGVTPPALGTPSGCNDKTVNSGWINSDPSSPANGWEYYRTGTKVKKIYDGAAWQNVTTVPAGSTLTAGGIPQFSDTNGHFSGTEYDASNPIPSSIAPGAAASTGVMFYSRATSGGTAWGGGAPAQNATKVIPFYYDGSKLASASSIAIQVTTADNSANVFDIGVYGPGCYNGAASVPLQAHTGPIAGSTINAGATGKAILALTGSPVTTTLTPGNWYCLAETSSAATPLLVLGGDNSTQYSPFGTAGNCSSCTTSSGTLNSTITAPALANQSGSQVPYVRVLP